jgi:hypothetical protein
LHEKEPRLFPHQPRFSLAATIHSKPKTSSPFFANQFVKIAMKYLVAGN